MQRDARAGLGGRARPIAWAAALAVLLATFPSVSFAQAAPAPAVAAPDAEGFAKEFEAAARLMSARNWGKAHEAWLALLRRHSGQDYVRPRVEEVRAELRRSAFWQVTKEPEPKAVVSGGLAYYARSSGQIDLRYSAETLGDFTRLETEEGLPLPGERSAALYMHPLTFHGPYTILLEARPEELVNVAVFVALDAGEGYLVQIGGEAGLSTYLHRILRLGRERPLAQCEPEPSKPGKGSKAKAVKASIQVDTKTIRYSYDGKKLFELENERAELGQWGLVVRGSFGVLQLKGTIEPSWIDGKQDAFVETAREAFQKTYVDPPELAPWKDVRRATSLEQRLTRMFRSVAIPGPFEPEQKALLDRLERLREDGRVLEAIGELRSLPVGALSPEASTLLLALCELQADRPGRALADLERHEELTPLSPTLLFLKARLLARVEGVAEAIEVLGALAQDETSDPAVHFELTQDLILLGRFDEARVALERGQAGRRQLTELGELRTQLAKATLGPEWRERFTQESERFTVASDINKEACRSAVRALDEAWSRCGEWFGAPSAAPPTRVFLFSGEAGYQGYALGIVHDELAGSLGAYSSLLKQILAWNASDRELLLRTLRHECGHRYLDLALGDVPIWLDEGLAEYVAASKLPNGRWQEGAVDERCSLGVRQGASSFTELRAFLRLEPGPFMEKAEFHYPEAWAFVHFLRRGGDATATGFLQRLWTELAAPTDAASAVDAALVGVDVAALQRAFSAHVVRLQSLEPARAR